MVLDTSALIAIAFEEDERSVFVDMISGTSTMMSAVNLYEAGLVAAAKKKNGKAAILIDELVARFDVTIVSVDSAMAIAARESYFRFGRGWHSAKLNFADCFAYALAKTREDTLLFKGDDFAQTDVVPAWRPET